MIAAIFCAALAAVAANAPAPSPAASAMPTAEAPQTPPGALPVPSPLESPAAPSAAPSATPTATPLYKYRVTPKPSPSDSPDSPQILEIELNDKQLAPHGKILIHVLTSPNVTKVITRSNGREGSLTEVAPGEFIGNGTIPGIPFIAHGWKVNIEFVASTADGRTTSVKVPVTLG